MYAGAARRDSSNVGGGTSQACRVHLSNISHIEQEMRTSSPSSPMRSDLSAIVSSISSLSAGEGPEAGDNDVVSTFLRPTTHCIAGSATDPIVTGCTFSSKRIRRTLEKTSTHDKQLSNRSRKDATRRRRTTEKTPTSRSRTPFPLRSRPMLPPTSQKGRRRR